MCRLETVKGWAIVKKGTEDNPWYLFDADTGHGWCQNKMLCFIWPTQETAKAWGLNRGLSKKQFRVIEISIENTWDTKLHAA